MERRALVSRSGVHNSNLMAGQKNFLPIPKSQNVMVLPTKRVHLSRKQARKTISWAKLAKWKASSGHIWPAGRMLCMPVLDQSLSLVSVYDFYWVLICFFSHVFLRALTNSTKCWPLKPPSRTRRPLWARSTSASSSRSWWPRATMRKDIRWT